MKCKLDNAFRCFLANFMKNGYQLERRISLVATWNCHIHSYNRNSHLHNYNRDSHARNALLKMILAWLQRTPTCIIPIKLVTHIFAAKTLTCINAAETSNCKLQQKQSPALLQQKDPLRKCSRKYHRHNCNKTSKPA